MPNFSTKEAARRFSAVLKAADKAPVIIERHGKPRVAVVSMRRYEIYEKLYWMMSDEMAAESLIEAMTAVGEGRLKTAARHRLMARFLGGNRG